MRSGLLPLFRSGPVEVARNRLVRRMDWRFLLPDAAPEHVVCFAPRLLDGLRATYRVVAHGGAATSCDLAVAQHPSRTISESAWAALRPGGTYYSEWLTPFPGRLVRVRRDLRAIGFEEIATYWFWPWGASVRLRAWLPVESPAALRYFFATRPPSPEPVSHGIHALLRAAWLGLLHNGLHALAVIARRPAAPGAAVIGKEDLDRLIRREWSSWGFGSSPRRLTWILLTGGPRSISKPVGLVFADDEPRPHLTVKFARVPESSAPILNEATVLRALPRSRAANGAPRVVFAQDRRGGAVVGETVLDGTPLSTVLRWATADELATAGTRWLCDLAGATTPTDPKEWWERLVGSRTREFARIYEEVVSDHELTAAKASLAKLGCLPLVCEHRDFAPWNVLLGRGGELNVLDWESAEQRGLPLCDLTYFLAYFAFFLEGAMKSRRFVKAYRRIFDSSTRMGSLASKQISAYCAALRIPHEARQPLRLFTWMVHSFSEYQRLVMDVGGRPSAERLRSGLFLALWREELNVGAEL
jgi:Ser/Thr protein kinase RdoA (MazF antagonist)